MATPAQIEANRRNSQKSTGPRTAAGKSASAQNALKHGLFSNAIVIPDDENADAFQAIQRDYFETCKPEGRLEIALVLELVRCDWLTRRTNAVEAQLWAHALDDRRGWLADNFNEDTPLAHGYNYLHKDLVLIQRRLTALSRAWNRASAELRKLQAARAAEPVSPPQPDPPPPSEIGFVPKKPAASALTAAPEPLTPPAQPRYNKEVRGDVAQMDRAAAS